MLERVARTHGFPMTMMPEELTLERLGPEFRKGSRLLDKFIVVRLLGAGGMGAVVEVQHAHLGGLFAMKVMLPSAMRQQKAIDRFMQEARAASTLKSEHVARVTDVGTLPSGLPFMVMEHLTGEDLDAVLKKRGPLSVGEVSLLICQACEAVAEAHAHGIVHRDLKPANLFITKRPNGAPNVKVLDFGISKEVGPDGQAPSKLTETGMIVGSAKYMAPERWDTKKQSDGRCDIWALGTILYECVTGVNPFDAGSMMEVIMKVHTVPTVPPSQLGAGIPREFDAVVMRCLEKSPEGRYASANELMAALEPFAMVAAGAPRASSPSMSQVVPTTPYPTVQPVVQTTAPMAHPPTHDETQPWNPSRTVAVDAKKENKLAVQVGIALLAAIGVVGAGLFAYRTWMRSGAPTEATQAPVVAQTAAIEPAPSLAAAPAASASATSRAALRIEDLPTVEAAPLPTAKALPKATTPIPTGSSKAATPTTSKPSAPGYDD